MRGANVGDNGTKVLKKVIVISRSDASELEKLLVKNGFKIAEKDPDFIVCYGGDGTVLFAERKFPQVAKLIVKRSSICRECDYTFNEIGSVLRKLRNQEFKIKKEMKLEAKFKKTRLIGLNEIQVHNKLPSSAIRFSVVVDGEEFDDLIGDGIVVATPFGSTGYHRSTGGKQFQKGIGISFNNLHNKKIKSFVTSEESTVTTRITRGPAWIIADNNENYVELMDHDVCTIRKSKSTADFIYVPK